MTRAGWIVPVVALAQASGCGPALIWSGRTPDRLERVEVVRDSSRQYVVIDGRRGAAYRAIAAWSMAFSDDGHLAFAARVEEGWVVVRDGVAGEVWESVGDLALSPKGRLAYAAERGGAWRVVDDGRAGPQFDLILAGTLRFSRDGRRLAYVGQVGGSVHAVVDGNLGPAFDGIGQLVFAGDGARLAYAARRGGDAYVVADGDVGPRWRAVAKLALSTTGGHLAYAALDGEDWRVVVDGEPGPAVDAVHRIVFRDDGRHVAWVAHVGDQDVLALDGAPVDASHRLRDEAVVFRSAAAPGAGPGLAYVAPVATGGERVVVDGAGSAIFDEVGAPVWSGDGRLGYAARRGEAWRMIVGGRELARGTWVSDPVFSRDGRRVAYLTRRGAAWSVVVDGREHRFDLVFDGTLAFSADSRRWAVIAGDLAHERLFFAVDGRTRIPLPAIEIYSAAARHEHAKLLDTRPDDTLLVWSQAEANRAAEPWGQTCVRADLSRNAQWEVIPASRSVAHGRQNSFFLDP